MKILACDPATSFGYAVLQIKDKRSTPTLLTSGVEVFPLNKLQAVGQRWINLTSWFDDLVQEHEPDVIVYEDVKRHVSTLSAHAYGYIKYSMEGVGFAHSVPTYPYITTVWKKDLTGNGRASKFDVESVVMNFYGSRKFISDDESDAIGIGLAYWFKPYRKMK